MPARFLTEVISANTRILIAPTKSPIAAEIFSQLESFPHFETVILTDTIRDSLKLSAEIIIYFAETTLSSLPKTLRLAHENKAKLILVLPENKLSLQEKVVSLVAHLNYTILELPGKIDTSTAALEIIHSFLPSFHPQQTLVSPVYKNPSKSKFFFKTLFLIIVIPWVLLLTQFFILIGLVNCSFYFFENNRLDRAVLCSRFAIPLSDTIRLLSPLAIGSYQLASFFGYPLPFTINTLKDFAHIFIMINEMGEKGYPFVVNLLNPTSTKNNTDLPGLISTFSETDEALASLQGELVHVPRFQKYLSIVSSWRESFGRFHLLSTALSELLSLNKESHFLLLLQDSTELRPSGGFLGQFAVLTLNNGHLIDVQFYDTYSSDGQLRGKIVPPVDFQLATGETSWYLRDANWDPDFPTAASRIAWFVNKEIAAPIDAVFAVNLQFVSQVLLVTGPVKIQGVSSSITSQNLISQYLMQTKKDPNTNGFFINLVQAIQSRLNTMNPSQIIQILSLFFKSFSSRQLFMFSLSNLPQISILGWDGGVRPSTCRSLLPCYADLSYLVDSNVGVNKVNPYIRQSALVTSTITSSQIQTSYLLNYSNTSSQSSWPEGEYKDYLRLILPRAVHIDSVTVNGQSLSGSRFQISSENGLLVLGLPFSVLPKTSLVLQINYHAPLQFLSQFHYQFDILNQPGQSPYPVTFDFHYPKEWFVSTNIPPTIASPGRLQYNRQLSSPQKIDVDISQP